MSQTSCLLVRGSYLMQPSLALILILFGYQMSAESFILLNECISQMVRNLNLFLHEIRFICYRLKIVHRNPAKLSHSQLSLCIFIWVCIT